MATLVRSRWLPSTFAVLVIASPGACGTSGGASNVETGTQQRQVPAPAEVSKVPQGRTATGDLAPSGLLHHRVLRIDQDFHPNDDYEIALDAWIDELHPDELLEVRMWWMDTAHDDERSVFGKGVRRHIDIEYERRSPRAWAVTIGQGSDRYTFEVELEDGDVKAWAKVQADDGTVYDRVLVGTSALVARKVLGLPVGFKRLAVSGTLPDGQAVSGALVSEPQS